MHSLPKCVHDSFSSIPRVIPQYIQPTNVVKVVPEEYGEANTYASIAELPHAANPHRHATYCLCAVHVPGKDQSTFSQIQQFAEYLRLTWPLPVDHMHPEMLKTLRNDPKSPRHFSDLSWSLSKSPPISLQDNYL